MNFNRRITVHIHLKAVVVLSVILSGFALLTAPIVTVHGQLPPQPAPAQACPTIRSLVTLAKFDLGNLSLRLQSKETTLTVGIGQISETTDSFYLQRLVVGVVNNTGGNLLNFSASNGHLSVTKIANGSSLAFSLDSLDYSAKPSYIQKMAPSIPLTQLHIHQLDMTILLNCTNQTYQTSYSASTSALSLVIGYLHSGVKI